MWVYSTITCAAEAARPRPSTPRFVQLNGTSSVKCCKMLEPKKRAADDTCFAQYRSCVFSNRTAPGSAKLRAEMDLLPEELREQGQCCDIFPSCAFFALWSALPMRHLLPRSYIYYLNGAASAAPKSSVCLIPVVTSTLLNSDTGTLGTIQTLYASLNQFVSLGGNNHIYRLETGPGREMRVMSRCQNHRGQIT
jgi:hypothetical protein